VQPVVSMSPMNLTLAKQKEKLKLQLTKKNFQSESSVSPIRSEVEDVTKVTRYEKLAKYLKTQEEKKETENVQIKNYGPGNFMSLD